jgi:transcriptional regulator with XRE-family HTH domain
VVATRQPSRARTPPRGAAKARVRSRQRRGRKAQRKKLYTTLGARIAALADGQDELANVLRVSQQSVSKKLRGKVGILVSELERLSAHYRVPMVYFFEENGEEPARRPEALAAFERAGQPGALREMVMLLSGLPSSTVKELLAEVKASLHDRKARPGRGHGRAPGRAGSRLAGAAAEEPPSYGER